MHVETREKSSEMRERAFSLEGEPQPAGWRYERTALLFLLSIIVLALVLRFWRLGYWNFQATEIFTARDSDGPHFSNPRPLGYVLNYYLVRPFLPLDEFGLRLLPAIFGVLAIPALYLVTKRLVGTRAALLGALLLTVSPLMVMYSQLARYWSLVFLLCAIYPYAIYLGVRQRNPRTLALGLVTGVLAALAHPVSVLLIGGPLVLLTTQVRGRHLRELWNQQSARWTALLLLILAGAIAIRFIPILQSWISEHDQSPGSGQFLLRTQPPGLKQIFYVMAYVESITLPLALIGALGIYLMWKERDRALGVFLASLAIFPIAFLSLLSLRTPVSQYYLLPTAPVFFIGAGAFLDRLYEVDWKLPTSWLLPATVTALVIAAGAPTLISDYRDGRRYDFRSVAHWLEPRLGPGDAIFSDQPMVLARYLPGRKVQRLRIPAPLMQSVRELSQDGDGKALWIVAPAPSHAFRTDLKRGGLIDWIYDHCQLRNTVGVGRVDLRQQYLQVYRCPPLPRGQSDTVIDPTAQAGL
jgi:hypothetical protein